MKRNTGKLFAVLICLSAFMMCSTVEAKEKKSKKEQQPSESDPRDR